MACYHPLVAWEHPEIKTEKGKRKFFFKNKPANVKNPELWENTLIPCGQCIGCRLDYSREWAIRCLLEKRESDDNYFITLTYSSDEEIESRLRKAKVNTITGEVVEYLDLIPDDLQKFMKDLRRYYEYHYKHTGIRFFACGEYGDKNKRPHFHLIIFNIPINDLKPWFLNSEHQQVYTSETISKIWKKGIVSIGEVTFQSAAYVARYIMKKQTGKGAEEEYKTPEFTQMSRNPGIGAAYFEKNKDKIYKNDELVISTKLNSVIAVKPPSYYDKLFDEVEPLKLSAIKEERRKKAQLIRNSQELNSTYTLTEQLEIQEREKARRAAMLKREMQDGV